MKSTLAMGQAMLVAVYPSSKIGCGPVLSGTEGKRAKNPNQGIASPKGTVGTLSEIKQLVMK